MTSAEKTPDTQAHRYRPYWATEQGVYGVILVSGLILVAGEYGRTSWDTFFQVIATVIVFWAAHVFAGIMSHPLLRSDTPVEVWSVIRDAERHGRGLLLAAVLPCFILLLGSFGWIGDHDSVLLAMWSGVLVLLVLGYQAFASRGFGWLGRIIGALATGLFGIVLIIVKALVH